VIAGAVLRQPASGPAAPADLPDPDHAYRFRLYIGGDTPNSAQALANLQAFCHRHLADDFTIEIVDVFREPARAMTVGVFMTPTLVRLAPGPVLRIVGTLAQETLLQALGLSPAMA
jgi:circadian clock protein KaiB